MPQTTATQDRSAWKAWKQYCKSLKTSPWRDDPDANSGRDAIGHGRETYLLAGFLIWSHMTMPARGGRLVPQPQSAMNRVTAIRRIHDREGWKMVPSSALQTVLKGLLRIYVEENGPEGLLVRHKQPFSR